MFPIVGVTIVIVVGMHTPMDMQNGVSWGALVREVLTQSAYKTKSDFAPPFSMGLFVPIPVEGVLLYRDRAIALPHFVWQGDVGRHL